MRIKSPDSGNRLLVWVVSLYLCVLMLPWSKKKPFSSIYKAQYCYLQLNTAVATLIFRPFLNDVLHDWQQSFSLDQHTSTCFQGAAAGVSETTSCNSFIQSHFQAAKMCATNAPFPATFKVSANCNKLHS